MEHLKNHKKNGSRVETSYSETEQKADDQKWEEILREVDQNGDGEISF